MRGSNDWYIPEVKLKKVLLQLTKKNICPNVFSLQE